MQKLPLGVASDFPGKDEFVSIMLEKTGMKSNLESFVQILLQIVIAALYYFNTHLFHVIVAIDLMGWSEPFERLLCLRTEVDENICQLITRHPKRVNPGKNSRKSKV